MNSENTIDTSLIKYNFNHNLNYKIENKKVPSFNLLSNKITQNIKDLKMISDLPYINKKSRIEKRWNDIIEVAKRDSTEEIYCYGTFLNNLNSDNYEVILSYRLKTKKQT